MMPIDIFINQLIQLGLADSFLDVINKHYLKITKIYNTISGVDEENIKDMNLVHNEDNDSINIIIELFEPIKELIFDNIDDELILNVDNNDYIINITVINTFESEDDIYENRFNGHRTSYTHKWS